MIKSRRALITGITGQDGSYLAELLLSKGYEVIGFARPASWYRSNNSSNFRDNIPVFFGDINDGVDLANAVQEAKADEIYHLASQSQPGESWARPTETLLANGLAAVRLFEAVRHHSPHSRVYHASSSEIFGRTSECPQSELTYLSPASPYAAAKTYAHHMAGVYRNSYGLYIANGILFNHESERRPLHFLTQKVAYGVACAFLGIFNSSELNERGRPIVECGRLSLGNLSVSRDWGYAPDFVRAMWLMLQQDQADDYVIGTGEPHTLEQLCQTAYGSVGLEWQNYIVSDPNLFRPLEPRQILANPAKAKARLGWRPSVNFATMVQRMVQAQIARVSSELNRC